MLKKIMRLFFKPGADSNSAENTSVELRQVDKLLSVLPDYDVVRGPLDREIPFDRQKCEAMIETTFGSSLFPENVVNAALKKARDVNGAILIEYLARARGAELLPWIETLLSSDRLFECARGATGLLAFDEVRALREMERIYMGALDGTIGLGSYDLLWINDNLLAHGTVNSLSLLTKLPDRDDYKKSRETLFITNINGILKEFEVAAERYLNHEIDLQDVGNLNIGNRLAEYVAEYFSCRLSKAGKLNTEQITGENLQIFRRAFRNLVSRLADPNIDNAQAMEATVRIVYQDISRLMPDEVTGDLVLIGFLHEKFQIDDIPDPAEKDRQLDDLSRRVREAVTDYLQSFEAPPKVNADDGSPSCGTFQVREPTSTSTDGDGKIEAQLRVREILKDFEAAAVSYQNHEIDLSDLDRLRVPQRLALYVASTNPREPVNQPGRLNVGEISGENVEILRRALNTLISRLADPKIDPAHELDGIASCVFSSLVDVVPDAEADVIATFIGLYMDNFQISDILDPAERAGKMNAFRREILEAANEYLLNCEAPPNG